MTVFRINLQHIFVSMEQNEKIKTNKNNVFWNCVISAIPVVLFFFVIGACWDFYYDLNDDITIRNIMSGAFAGSPDIHTIYVKVLFSVFPALLYKIIPSIPWFGIIEIALLAVSSFICNLSLCSLSDKKWIKIILSIGMTILFEAPLLYQNVFIQYTVVSGILAAAGTMFFFFTKFDNLKSYTIKLIPPVLFFVISFSLRDNMFLFVTPFIFFIILVKYIDGLIENKKTSGSQENKNKFQKNTFLIYILPIVVTSILLLAAIGVEKIAYSSKAWREYNEFNSYRTTIFDFQKDAPWYMFHSDFYDEIGYSEAEAQVLVDTNLEFSDRIDTDLLKKVSAYNEARLQKGFFAVPFKEALTFYIYTLHRTRECKYCFLIMALYVLLGSVIVLRKKWHYLIFEALLFFIKSADWMFLILRGRIKDRVTTPLCFMEITVLLCLIFKLAAEEKSAYVLIAIMAVALIMNKPIFKENIKEVNAETNARATKDAGWINFKDYCAKNSENFYFIDLISNISYSEKIFDKDESEFRNYELSGGWMSKSPLYKKKISSRGIEKVDEALLLKDDVYFVTIDFRDCEWMKQYYKDKGYEIILQETDRLDIDGEQSYCIYSVNPAK